MACKLVVLLSLLAAVNAGYLAAPAYSHASYSYGAPHAVAAPAVVSQHANILRSHGNLGQVSTYSKSINTPYSSVSKSDIRVSNDALAYPYAHGYAAPVAPAYSHTYSAPAYTQSYAAPAYSHSYAAPAYAHAPSYAAPAYAHGYAAHAPAGLLGVAYSAAPAAAHFTYSNGYGVHYSY